MTIGDKIKQKRKKHRLTQKKLSELTGIAEITIRQYEANKYNPKIDNLRKIASALNAQLEEFIDMNQPLKEYHTEDGASISNVLSKNKDGILNHCQTIRISSSKISETYELNQSLQHYYSMLNINGQREAVKRLEELASLTKYTS